MWERLPSQSLPWAATFPLICHFAHSLPCTLNKTRYSPTQTDLENQLFWKKQTCPWVVLETTVVNTSTECDGVVQFLAGSQTRNTYCTKTEQKSPRWDGTSDKPSTIFSRVMLNPPPTQVAVRVLQEAKQYIVDTHKLQKLSDGYTVPLISLLSAMFLKSSCTHPTG